MKKFLILSVAALMASSPVLSTANAQSHGPQRIEQRPSENRPAARKDQARQGEWRKGALYSGRGSRVTDYRRHNLKAPPKGHRWVRDGNDFLLIAIGSGVIASVVHGR